MFVLVLDTHQPSTFFSIITVLTLIFLIFIRDS